MANLLDKASILLTPTGYDNGKMLSIKPTGGDGDFTFSRNSAATRVNAQGLVENVQILSGDLVQNGSFSQIGAELITNGSFSNGSTDWTLNDWTVADGKASLINGSSFITQASVLEIGKTYKIQYTISDYVSGTIRWRANGVNGSVNSSNGVVTDFITPASTTFSIQGYNTFNGSISNISAKEVGQNWTFGDGFTPDQANSKVTCDGTQSAATNLIQTISTNIQNKLVRISFTLNISAGALSGSLNNSGGAEFSNLTTSGSYTAEATSGDINPTILLQGDANFVGSITNIVIKEVTNDTNLPRINYENGCGSWLLENESTNIVTYSELFSHESWIKNSTLNVTINNALSPDGTQNATRVNKAGSGSRLGVEISIASGQSYTLSFYMKNNGGVTSFQTNFDGQSANQSYTITDDWQRYKFTFLATATETSQIRLFTSSANIDAHIWGAQLEQQPFATSYIPTSGASSTRLKDIAPNSGNSTLINSTEGVLYAEIAALENNGESIRSISLGVNGDNNQTITIRFRNQSNTIGLFMKPLSPNNLNLSTSSFDVLNFNKIALKYKSGQIALWINGSEVITSTNTFNISGLNNLTFGTGGSSSFYGKVKALGVFKEALTDAELTALTTI